MSNRSRIAIMGTRGVPAAYGGFETFAEELGARLAERGHDVTVYGRSHVVPPGLRHHRGMRLRVLPTIRHKYLDTVVHTAVSVLDGLLRRFDVVLICNNANAPFAVVPRITGAKVALNVDGLEWHREKWSRVGRWYYQACAWLSPKLPITLVTDARVIARYYHDRFGKATAFIPYGSDSRRLPPGPTIDRLGLEAGRYILYVSRFEPENHAHTVLEAYRRAGGLEALGVPIVLVGDAPYATDYRARIDDLAADTPGVILPGYVFGDGYVELQSNALLYVQATEVGGTHPALVEAMGRGATIVANRVPEHSEVLGEAGRYYERNDATSLAEQMTALVAQPETRAELGRAAAERAEEQFSWGHVTDEYEALFNRLRDGTVAAVDGRPGRSGRPAVVDAAPAGDDTRRAGRRVTLFGLDIDALTMDETLDAIDAMIAEGGTHQHVVVNVAKVVQANADPEFRAIVNGCDLINADGQPIVWAARLLGRPLPERVTGVDLMVRLFDRAEKAGYGVYLLGARRPVVSAVVQRLARDHPRLRVVGWREGYWTEEEEEAMVDEIAATHPTILLLGIPSPAKERFLGRWKERIGASFVMGVGGSFDVYGGLVRRAPRWMQRAGLEWAFRMIQEPGRMWRRYTHDGTRFLWLVIRTVAQRRP